MIVKNYYSFPKETFFLVYTFHRQIYKKREKIIGKNFYDQLQLGRVSFAKLIRIILCIKKSKFSTGENKFSACILKH